MENLITRAYNRFEINKTRGIIRKLSSTERLRDEIWYYLKINRNFPGQAILFPRVIDSWSHTKDYWIDLEMYSYPNTGSYLFGDNVMPSWTEFFTSVRDILAEWSTISPLMEWTADEVQQAATDMYITKTEREFNNFYDGWRDKFEHLFIGETPTQTVIINEKEYFMFEIIWPQIKQYIQDHMLNFTPSLIHGDCCFSNILYGHDKNIIRFIDPRGSFGKTGIYGDIRYDVAKLSHSIDGTYEAFITDKFSVHADNNSYELIIKNNDAELKLAQTEFESIFFPTFKKKEIKIIQGCIFIGMVARHYDNLERQRAMHLTGVRLLNEALQL